MKTLVIAYKYPLPENSGDRIRTMNFVRYFKKLGDVDVLYFHQADQGVETGPPFDKAFYVDIDEGDDRKSKLLYLYEKIKYTKPWVLSNYTKQSIKITHDIIEQGHYDYILCRNALNAFPLFFLSEKLKKRIILDIDDIITADLHGSAHSAVSNDKLTKKIKTLIDYKFYQLYQLKCARLGKSLLCSEKDRKIISKHINPENLFIVPNVVRGFDLCDGYNKNGHCNIGTILFIGHLSYIPNVQGLKWFIHEIFDRLISDGHTIKLLIAGKEPDLQLRAICSEYNQIELVDTPPDIVPFYDRCGAVIVPLLAGGGTRIKILESGHALRPIITTKIGAYGLNLKDYNNVLYMSDYYSFVERYNWLKNVNNYVRLTNNMHEYVRDNYKIKNFEDAMNNVTEH
jgi:glycosyltransferase involved in cell wall biosynthesis